MTYAFQVETCRQVAYSLRLPFVDLRAYRISPGILRKLPTRFAVRYRCVPMVYNHRRVLLVHDNPADIFFLSTNPDVLDILGLGGPEGAVVLEFALTTKAALDESLERCVSLP